MTLSVVVATYRRPALCRNAAISLINQTHPGIEVLVVNDGDLVSDYRCVTELPVTYVALDANQGLSAVRNVGAAQASGQVLGFLDDDDRWLPDFAAALLETMKAENADIVYGAGFMPTPSGPELLDHAYPFDYDQLLRRNYITPSATIIRKDVFETIGGFDPALHQNGMNAPEDWDLWIRLAQAGYKFARCPFVGLVYGADTPGRLCDAAWRTGAMQRGYDYIARKLGVHLGG